MTFDLTPWKDRGKNVKVVRGDWWDLEHTLEQLHREMDEVFGHFLHGFETPFRPMEQLGTGWLTPARVHSDFRSPSVDVSETDSEIQVSADLPGLSEKDVQLTLDRDRLTIRGEIKHERDENEKDYHVMERRYGEFQRVIPLPTGIDPDKATATFKKGVLNVTIAKTPEAKKESKKINIETA